MKQIKIPIEQFIAEVCAGKINETPISYRSKLKRFESWMNQKHYQFCDLSIRRMDEFIQTMQCQRLSPFTIHTTMMTVRHFLKWAYQTNRLKLNFEAMKIPHMPRPEPKAIEAQSALDLLKAASRTGEQWERARNLALLYVLRDTGGRIGAIIHADIDQLDLKRGKLFVREKGNQPHFLYLNPPTIAALCEWLKYRPQLRPKDKKLFLSQFGRGLKRNSIYSLITRIKRNAEPIQGRCNPHAYRHAWARDALTAGEDISKVARTLGNSVRVTAEYYALWNDREVQEAHARYSPGRNLPIIKPQED